MTRQVDKEEALIARLGKLPVDQFKVAALNAFRNLPATGTQRAVPASPNKNDAQIRKGLLKGLLKIREVKTHFSKVINATAAGEVNFVMTSSGKTVVMVSLDRIEALVQEARHSRTLAEAYAPSEYFPRLEANLEFEEKEGEESERFELP